MEAFENHKDRYAYDACKGDPDAWANWQMLHKWLDDMNAEDKDRLS